ncbi:MAG: ATP-binding cassette domain-containing protein, partial [Clostridium sp.]|nr:ATP-binding cassette domain-containing protein [Clostridium sp.]
MLELKNLNVHYGAIHALKGIDLKIEKGEIVTLIGANGAGKSTTLRTISGLEKPSSGEIIYKGKPLTPSPSKTVKLGIS